MTYKHRPHKWSALMLPEHGERLRELEAAQDDVPRPVLDEQAADAIAYALTAAFESGSPVTISLYQNRRVKRITGRLSGTAQAPILLGADGERQSFRLTDLVAAEG